jgi:hypothetical protein
MLGEFLIHKRKATGGERRSAGTAGCSSPTCETRTRATTGSRLCGLGCLSSGGFACMATMPTMPPG